MGPSAAWFYEDQPSPPPKQQQSQPLIILMVMMVEGQLVVGGLSIARPACSRVLRVEPLTHTIMTSPDWRTLFITWNDHTQNWIKTGAAYFISWMNGILQLHHTCKVVPAVYLAVGLSRTCAVKKRLNGSTFCFG